MCVLIGYFAWCVILRLHVTLPVASWGCTVPFLFLLCHLVRIRVVCVRLFAFWDAGCFVSVCTCCSHVFSCLSFLFCLLCVHAALMIVLRAFFFLGSFLLVTCSFHFTCSGVRCFWLLHVMPIMVIQVVVPCGSCGMFLLPFLLLLLLSSYASRCLASEFYWQSCSGDWLCRCDTWAWAWVVIRWWVWLGSHV